MKPSISLAAIALVVLPLTSAQAPRQATFGGEPGSARMATFRGRVSFDIPAGGVFAVQLASLSDLVVDRAVLNGDGTFEFQGLQPGAFGLKIVTTGGQVVHEQSVFVVGTDQTVEVSVRLRSKSFPGGTISANQLKHKVPALAQKEFDKAVRAARNNDHAAAMDHFRKAAAIDPEFADAYDGIAGEYAAAEDYEHAAEQYQKTIELAPEHRDALPNLSIVWFKLHRYSEAGEMARRALRVVPGMSKLHYILGITLLTSDVNRKEALDNLERASAEIPQAHLFAAKVLAEDGQRDGAVRHLTEYLAQPQLDGENRDKVRAWLAEIQK